MGAVAVLGASYLSSGGFTSAFGYAAGSFLLQRFVGSTPVKGPRLDDLSVQGSDMDIPIPKLYGKGRLAGNVIWSTGIKEVKKEETVGKGGGQDVINYTYHSSFAVMPCLGPIARPLKIWFGDKVMFDATGDKHKGANFSYDADNDCYFADTGTKQSARMWLYRGTQEQMPNPLIEEDLGVGSTPAFRGRVVFVVEKLQLENWGNSIPPITMLLENCTTVARNIALDISERAGLDTNRHCDYRELGADFNEGFILKDNTAAREYLNMLGTRHGCEWPERDGRIVAVKYGKESCITIPEQDLRVKEDGGVETPETEWKREQEATLPYQERVQFLDTARNYTANAQAAQREVTPSEVKDSIVLPMVMDGATALQIASRELYRKWLERESPTIQLGWKYLWLAPSDTITIPTTAGLRDVRLQGGQTPYLGPIVYKAVLSSDRLQVQPLGENTAGPTYPEVLEIGEVHALLIEANSARDSFNDLPGLYAAATVPIGTEWSGVVVQPSNAGIGEGVTLTSPATMGACVTRLQNHEDADFWDEDNSFVVDIERGTLATAAELEVLNVANAAFVQCGSGWELIQFQNAESLGVVDGKNRYRLSRFLRGRRGTELFMSGHAPGDVFLLLNTAVAHIPMPLSSVGMETSWLFAGDESETEKTIIMAGEHLLPYAPCDAAAARDDSGNMSVTWKRRSRYRGAVLNDPQLGEATESYSAEILGQSGEVLRTFTVSTPAFSYTASQQVTDFGSVQSSVRMKITMNSQSVGRGYALDVTI